MTWIILRRWEASVGTSVVRADSVRGLVRRGIVAGLSMGFNPVPVQRCSALVWVVPDKTLSQFVKRENFLRS
jgi:phage head maturation protease